MSRRLKDPLLEKYLAGALDEAARADLEKTLAQSPEDLRRVEELRADSAAFLVQHPPAAFAAKVARPAWGGWKPWAWLPLAAAVAAGVLLVVRRPVEPEEELTVKGAVVLVLHRKVADASELVGAGAALHAGDTLRFEIRAPGRGWVAVLGVDPAGAPTLYAPPGGTQPIHLESGTAVLDDAVVLDDAKGPESFLVVWASAPYDLQAVLAGLKQGRKVEATVPGSKVVLQSYPKE